MDPLFPVLPEDLSALSREELEQLLEEHNQAAELIDANDEDFLKGMSGDDVLAQYDVGLEQIDKIVAAIKVLDDQQENYDTGISDKRQARLEMLGKSEEAEEDEPKPDDGDGDEGGAVVEAAEEITAEASAEETATEQPTEGEAVEQERELVTASVEKKENKPALRVPKASADRQMPSEKKVMLTAALGLQETRAGAPLGRMDYAKVISKEAQRWGAPTPSENGREEKLRIARMEFEYPEERILSHENDFSNTEKIRAVIPRGTGWGELDGQALTASGGLCAPFTPFYDMPNFAQRGRPVR